MEKLAVKENRFSETIDKVEAEIIKNYLLKWPTEMKIPVIDLVRIFFLHFSSEDIFSGYDQGLVFLSTVLTHLSSDTKEILKTVTMRALCNLFMQVSSTKSLFMMLEHLLKLLIKSSLLESKKSAT